MMEGARQGDLTSSGRQFSKGGGREGPKNTRVCNAEEVVSSSLAFYFEAKIDELQFKNTKSKSRYLLAVHLKTGIST